MLYVHVCTSRVAFFSERANQGAFGNDICCVPRRPTRWCIFVPSDPLLSSCSRDIIRETRRACLLHACGLLAVSCAHSLPRCAPCAPSALSARCSRTGRWRSASMQLALSSSVKAARPTSCSCGPWRACRLRVPAPVAQRPLCPLLPRPLKHARRILPCATARGAPAPGPPPNPLDALRKELGVQSNRLDPAQREAVESAITALGGRVTVGQVAARAGVRLADADAALKALAYDSLAHLEVRNSTDRTHDWMAGAGQPASAPARQPSRACSCSNSCSTSSEPSKLLRGAKLCVCCPCIHSKT